MGVKQRIKFKIDRDRGTNSAKGVSLALSDNAKASDEARRSEVESTELDGVHPDDMKFIDHLKKFFKG